MSFLQPAPRLNNPYSHDRVLQNWLRSVFPASHRPSLTPDLQALARYAMAAYAEHLITPRQEPVLTQWDAWGARVDRITLTPTWERGAGITAQHGLLWSGHVEDPEGWMRCAQFARVYLYHVASEFYTCPLAMTDGATTVLKASEAPALSERALPHFLSHDPEKLWLSGQWMTETPGGSDVSRTETVARQDAQGQWRLYGRKWFSSAVIGEAAMALARPAGAGPGSSAIGLFYVETRDDNGDWNGLQVQRLKDKLGTRELPTAEVDLDGLPAWPIGEPKHGVRRIAPMLNITRTWNSICAMATTRRAIALAIDYCHRRQAFGEYLLEQPLHRGTLADLVPEFEAGFHLSFAVARLLGQVESGCATDTETAVWRILTPLAKLWTGKLAVEITSECLEAIGGASYIEDTGLPQLLRDAQVYPLWEGTTNVLALDTLRALGQTGIEPLRQFIEQRLRNTDPATAVTIRSPFEASARFLEQAAKQRSHLEAGARGLALTLARTTAAALLAENSGLANADPRTGLALQRFLSHGLDRLPEKYDDALAEASLLDDNPSSD